MAGENFIVQAPIEAVKHSATPPAPTAGTLAIYPKTDDKWYQQTSGGVETEIGAGSSSRTFAYWAG